MCITFFYLNDVNPKQHARHIRFVIAFNRDENENRPTLSFEQWSDDPNVYSGRDLKSGGTWIGVNVSTGLMVILTNYRLIIKRSAKSRGLLTKLFISSSYVKEALSPSALSQKIVSDLTAILQNPKEYSAFNLCVYNIRDNRLFYICSETGMKVPMELSAGAVHGFSNADIDSKWDKVDRGKQMFGKVVEIIKQREWTHCEENEKTRDLLYEEMEHVMKDRQGACGPQMVTEPSIFIPKYFSPLFLGYRRTKSTFYAVVSVDQDQRIQASIKEVTYADNDQQKQVNFQLKI